MMTDRELLELLVEKVTGIDVRVGSMESRMDSMEGRMNSFEIELKGFRAEVNTKLDNLQAQNDVIAMHVLNHTEQLRVLSKRPV